MTMGRPKTKQPIALFAAVRDGNIRPGAAAKKCGLPAGAFYQRFLRFLSEQRRQRTTRARQAANSFLQECKVMGFSEDDCRGLGALWWKHHDENGNQLNPYRAYQ